jgi:tetratricopeptide (TPR) repeat protein
MQYKYLYRAFGIIAFAISLVVLFLTVQPTVPFWDCGEFSAASVWQQVPHPPGAPLFLMIGKLFHMLIPFGDPGWRVNLVSVFSSAFTVWLLYIITVKVIFNFRKEFIKTMADELAIYGAALVGALALLFSDTFWFNAVESEVYAMSTLFVAVIVYLMMRWFEEADNPGHERYLLLIAYLMGLSTGVHLLSILTIFSIVLLVYFKKYKLTFSSFIIMGIFAIVVFFLVYPGMVKWFPALLDGSLPFKNACREYTVEQQPIITVLTILGILFIGFALWWGHQKKNPYIKLITMSLLLMVLGYTTYTQILIRANANPPMNENYPHNLHELTKYLGREQYGDAPFWPRRYHNDSYYIRFYEKKDREGNYEYGKWNSPSYEFKECKDGQRGIRKPDFKNADFSSEMKYFFKYQVNHMYWRYFLWNFVGRESDIQDAGSYAFGSTKNADIINYKSGYADIYPISFYGIPLLIGLIGLFFHFYRDPKMAIVFLVMFLLMGVISAIQQNQQQPQPRERDYFYTGSFFVWCMWIAMGTYGIIERLGKKKINTVIAGGVIGVMLLAVPLNMAIGGWKMHSRAGNYIPFDYSYNILQSCEENAIIFTNGDNDTFPLWYLQDVAGVRRDVRVVNLSLGNTLWYLDQLKNQQPWGAEKVPLSFSDASIQCDESDDGALSYEYSEAMDVKIPVAPEILAKYTDDPDVISRGVMEYQHLGKQNSTDENGKTIYIMRVQDKLVLDILKNVRFTRPVYFSTTVGPDAFCGLERFFRFEGMAMRICPVPQKTGNFEPVDPEIMSQTLMNVDNSDNYSTTQKYGFKFRNLANPDVFYDEVHRRLIPNYRQLYLTYAVYEKQESQNKERAIEIINMMNEMLSPETFPLSFEEEYKISKLYKECGADEQSEKFARMCIESCKEIIGNKYLLEDLKYYEIRGRYMGPYRVAMQMYESIGDYDGAIEMCQMLHDKSSQLFEQQQNSSTDQRELQALYSSIYDLKVMKDMLEVKKIEASGDIAGAIKRAEEILDGYMKKGQEAEAFMFFGRDIATKLNELKAKLGKDTLAEVSAN